LEYDTDTLYCVQNKSAINHVFQRNIANGSRPGWWIKIIIIMCVSKKGKRERGNKFVKVFTHS
jgi:hypothetical protein